MYDLNSLIVDVNSGFEMFYISTRIHALGEQRVGVVLGPCAQSQNLSEEETVGRLVAAGKRLREGGFEQILVLSECCGTYCDGVIAATKKQAPEIEWLFYNDAPDLGTAGPRLKACEVTEWLICHGRAAVI